MPLFTPFATSSGALDLSGPLGFFGATPKPQPGTYAMPGGITTSRTMDSYTPVVLATPYAGSLLDLSQAARLTHANELRTAYENLRTFTESLARHHAALVSDLKALGLIA